MQFNLITILGPTAVGKTSLAAKLAHRFNGEIISADSRQVYRKLDIGTGKDLADYNVNGDPVLYHLIDVASPNEEFNLFRFNKLFYEAFDLIEQNNKVPFLVGGTGLFLYSVLKGYDLKEVDFNTPRFTELEKTDLDELTHLLKQINPALHNTTDLLIKERIIKAIMIAEAEALHKQVERKIINSLVIGVKMEKEDIKSSITRRLKQRLDEGMVEEVEKLVEESVTYEKLLFWGLEYKFIGMYLKGELNYNDMFQKLNSSIHKFAKRQMTWFRKMEREGITIHWLDGPDFEKASEIIENKYFNNA
ncbi:tRNA (adenosine(37)-N6)-dimethylallyltransferase MiaA [Bacteroidota bacterium]